MCPSGLALCHPAADLLHEWATYGCPTNTGTPWTAEQMQAAVNRGPHRSALSNKAIAHFKAEVNEKVKSGQAKLVSWDDIKDNPPAELKISPIAAIPHKSKQFRSILDLIREVSYHRSTQRPYKQPPRAQWTNWVIPSLVSFMPLRRPRRIHASSWPNGAEEGTEWNFSYALPQHPGEPIYLVVPTSLQMG